MRIIAGEYRSRKLRTVPGLDVRPTPDRLRETLFNVLAPRIAGTIFLDAYAGSGAVGIEALSRGAKRVILIERKHAAGGSDSGKPGITWHRETGGHCGGADKPAF